MNEQAKNIFMAAPDLLQVVIKVPHYDLTLGRKYFSDRTVSKELCSKIIDMIESENKKQKAEKPKEEKPKTEKPKVKKKYK